ncbi:hypothetical protein LAZ67_8001323 [Cordylochernes scorpioides]|uniref:Uncharacterized protein n=1 Tax=Cordylochernes scorpioides TaxID=51811 RepID=A0ABY6KQL5_9ARAC|nr:hypothetical protein LAZ67_8001323 [Cordylochernes scorpioides]
MEAEKLSHLMKNPANDSPCSPKTDLISRFVAFFSNQQDECENHLKMYREELKLNLLIVAMNRIYLKKNVHQVLTKKIKLREKGPVLRLPYIPRGGLGRPLWSCRCALFEGLCIILEEEQSGMASFELEIQGIPPHTGFAVFTRQQEEREEETFTTKISTAGETIARSNTEEPLPEMNTLGSVTQLRRRRRLQGREPILQPLPQQIEMEDDHRPTVNRSYLPCQRQRDPSTFSGDGNINPGRWLKEYERGSKYNR